MPSFKSLKSLAPLGVIIGFGGLLVAAVIWLLNRQFDLSVKIALAVGVLGFALAVVFNPDAVLKWLGGRQARYGSNVALMTLAFIGILVIVNYLVINGPIPAEWKRKDLTQNQLYTLAPETVAAIQQLPAPVKAVGFYSVRNFSSERDTISKLLERYRVASKGTFTYEFHDPLTEPAVTKAYNVSGDGSIVLVMGQERDELHLPAEQDITGGLIGLSHPTTRVIYFLTGHGERDISTAADANLSRGVDLLTKQKYTVLPLSLQVTPTVPSDARELVIAGPLKPLGAAEVKAIGDYLDRGGALLAMLDPSIQTQIDPTQADPLVDYLASAWGINVQQDVVVDNYNSPSGQPLIPLNKGYETSPITARLQKIDTGFPGARSLAVFGAADTFPNITYTPLIKTDPRAWGETNTQSLIDGNPQQGQGDVPGPLTLAVSAENSKTKARLVVFGDSDFADDQYFDLGANSLLFLNSVNWASLEESLINLSPKVPTTRTLTIVSNLTVNLILLITVFVMPACVVVMGIVVWFMRRRHV